MSLRHAVLGLLSESPASGYDLMKLFNASLTSVWPATQSQVYGELNKLTTAGLVEVAAHGPRGRKEYAITDDGLAELRHWLTEVAPTGPQRHDGLLRVFFLGILTPLEAQSYLLTQAETAARAHAAYEQIDRTAEWDDEMISVYGRIALEYGLRMSATMEEWARWAADEVTGAKARKAGELARAQRGRERPEQDEQPAGERPGGD
ncbi:PadR family transcriptional regulator [Streptomyces noursei]|uniref:PadR family transcriptional regulator n=1 Tax=Streptomyces noursei TaxID=1971 RepID=UPI001671B061|nr:helix-turn-helix transcriptional regulator [Streptomyces noursei]MCZ1016959.1 helix-turn-helix transcriptional regulator [Streptomyces noursei]GGX05772.1 PadR family transcriptional regulator [Streptomyces noursei]